MSTLISVYNSDGLVGRCDAKCHDATQPNCDCVCGGMNHGAGRKKAMENTRQHAESMIKEYAERLGLEEGKFTWDKNPSLGQLEFDLVAA